MASASIGLLLRELVYYRLENPHSQQRTRGLGFCRRRGWRALCGCGMMSLFHKSSLRFKHLLLNRIRLQCGVDIRLCLWRGGRIVFIRLELFFPFFAYLCKFK